METITCCSRCLWMLWLIVINTCFLCWSEEIISDCSQVERGSHIKEKTLVLRLIAIIHKTNTGLLRVLLWPTRLVRKTFSHLPFLHCYLEGLPLKKIKYSWIFFSL